MSGDDPTEFTDFIVLAQSTFITERWWRMGQTYFNVLDRVRPDLANKVRATMYDPFYRDENINDFLRFVAEHWDDDLKEARR